MASVLYNRSRGKGGRGLRGLAPWRSMRQRLMRAPARLPPAHLSRTAFCPLSPAPLSPCFHPHSVGGLPPSVPAGVLNSRGAAISVANCRDAVACLPTFCRNRAVTPTRRFRILRRIQSSCIPDTPMLLAGFCAWPRLPPCGCNADRRPLRSPTTDAATPPACGRSPPPLSSWPACCSSARAKKKVVVAIARKLAVLLHRLWVTGEVYDPHYNRKAAAAAKRKTRPAA